MILPLQFYSQFILSWHLHYPRTLLGTADSISMTRMTDSDTTSSVYECINAGNKIINRKTISPAGRFFIRWTDMDGLRAEDLHD